MNNDYQLPQNVFDSGIHYPTQISQNLNYFIYLTIDNPSIQNLNASRIYPNHNFEGTVPKHDNPTLSSDPSTIFNYNPYIQFNYAAMNEIFNNHNYYLATLPQNYLPQNRGVSLLNSKRKNPINVTEVLPKLNQDFCEKKNDIIKNNNVLDNDGVNKKDGEIEEQKETNKYYEERKEKKLLESKNKECNDKESATYEKNKNEKNKKYGIKKKKMCQELLHDSFLEHIGETKPRMITLDEQLSVVIPNNNAKKKSANIQNNKDKKKEKPFQRNDSNKIHYKKINKNKTSNINYQPTKVIYHGNSYEKTKDIKDFMKYNFNFCVEEQYKSKRLIVDYENQHVNLEALNDGFFKKDNSNETIELNNEAKWLRSKFKGDNHQLKKAINLIQEILKSSRNVVEQEKCLDIIRINDYNMGEISKFNACK